MINLKEVITKYPDCFESVNKLRSYLCDLYPTEKRDITILCLLFKSGIAEEIKKANGKIEEITINSYVVRLENEYGISRRFARDGLNTFISATDSDDDKVKCNNNVDERENTTIINKPQKYKICPRCETNYILENESLCDICKGKFKIVQAESPTRYYHDPNDIFDDGDDGNELDLGYLEDIKDPNN